MSHCKCTFNVPLCYNPEKPGATPKAVEAEYFDAIENAMDRVFGGYTDEGVKPGSWHGHREKSQWYAVYALPQDLQRVRDFVNEIGVKLAQAQMALEIGPATTELLDVDPEKLKTDPEQSGGQQSIDWPEAK
jgi:hypothetical protein